MNIQNEDLGRQLRDFGVPVVEGDGEVVLAGLFLVENLTRPSGISVARNRVVAQGLNYMAGVAIGSASKIANWYIAPFAGNVTPASNLTGQNFAGTTTEFTNYTEGTRRSFSPGAASSGVIGNLSARAEITIGNGGQDVIYGLGILSASTKGDSSSGTTLFAAARLNSARDNLQEGDVIALGYQLSVIDPTA